MLLAAIQTIGFLLSFGINSSIQHWTLKAENPTHKTSDQITQQNESIDSQVNSAAQYEINLDTVSQTIAGGDENEHQFEYRQARGN
jgi:hypothetical protein